MEKDDEQKTYIEKKQKEIKQHYDTNKYYIVNYEEDLQETDNCGHPSKLIEEMARIYDDQG